TMPSFWWRKPPPRNGTGRALAASIGRAAAPSWARSCDIGNLQIRLACFFAHDLPHLTLQPVEFGDAVGALGKRHVDFDHLADASGAPRKHDDPVSEPHGFGQVVGDV